VHVRVYVCVCMWLRVRAYVLSSSIAEHVQALS
jgi:hypothetical protein